MNSGIKTLLSFPWFPRDARQELSLARQGVLLAGFVALAVMTTAPARAGTPAAVNFTTPGGPYTFTVPAGVTQVTFDVYGARGGRGGSGTVPSDSGGLGGVGGRATATYTVVPGQVFTLFVGGVGGNGGQGSGATPAGGINGGGAGGNTSCGACATFRAGGGGGASDVRSGGVALANRILIAGGGGGGGGHAVGGPGGGGGGAAGANGTGGSPVGITSGGGGGTGAGGGPGIGNTLPGGAPNSPGSPGGSGSGGTGGGSFYSGGGGGGGGRFGGGGGGGGFGGSGGGGGSGLGPAGVTFSANNQTTNGQIVVGFSGVSVEQAAGQNDPTNDASIDFTVAFTQPTVGFNSSGVVLSGTAAPTTKSVTEIAPFNGTTYNIAVGGMTGDGRVIVNIPANAGGNGNTASTSVDNVVTYDGTSPTVTINQASGQADPTNVSPIHFTAVFSDRVTGFANGEVTLGGTANASGSIVTEITPFNGTTYDVLVIGVSGVGAVFPTIDAGVAQDTVGNGNAASSSIDNTVFFDGVGPTVTIKQEGGQADPTNSSPIVFTAVFDEPAFGFDETDVTVGGTAGAATAVVSQLPPNNRTHYRISVGDMTGTGTVTVSVAAGAATDTLGNPSSDPTIADNEVTYDITLPTVTVEQVGPDPTNVHPIHFTVTFSEPVSGFGASGVQITGTATGASTTATVTEVSGQTLYDVAIGDLVGDGTVVVDILAGAATDAAGNPNAASSGGDNQVTYDAATPSVTINQASGQADPTNAGAIHFTVFFSERVNFTSGDVTSSGSAAPTTQLVQEIDPHDGTSYDVEVGGMSGDGTVIADIAEGAALDAAGNGNSSSTSDDNVVLYDATAPRVRIDQAGSDPSSSIHFTAVFDEPVVGFEGSDVTLTGTSALTATATESGPGGGHVVAGGKVATVTEIAPFDSTTYDVEVTGMASDGTVIADIPAGAAKDPAGNDNTASSSTDNVITYDRSGPSVTINQSASQTDTTRISPISFTAVFNEPINDFTTGDVTVTGTAGGTAVAVAETAPFDRTTYSVLVSGMTGSGTVIATLAANVANDGAGNGNSASASSDSTVVYDVTSPLVTINQAAGQADPTSGSPINFSVVFSEPMLGFEPSDVTVTGTAGGTAGVVTETAPFDRTTYSASVSGMTGSGTVIATIAANMATDRPGNGNTASSSTDNVVTYDVRRPGVTINQAAGQADPTSGSPINFSVVFDEPVKGFATGDVTVSGTAAGALTATVTRIAPNDSTTYNVAVSGMTASGTVIARINASVAQDVAGNGNTASTSTDSTVTFNFGPVNFAANPGFEDSPLPWVGVGSNVTLSRVNGGAHGGTWSMRVRSTSSSAFGCDDQPDFVKPVAGAGAVYRFSLWVKSTDNTKEIKFLVAELRSNGSQLGASVASNEVSLSTTWKLLTATVTTLQEGSSLSLRILESPGSSNKSFQVDDVLIERLQTYTIVSSAGAGGGIAPLGSRVLIQGASQSYTITPNAGYRISDVLVDNVSAGAVPSYTFPNVTANHTIEARFALIPPGENLVRNPGFEQNLNGWDTYGSDVTLARLLGTTVSGAHGGSYVMEVKSRSSSSFGCDDEPNWVARVVGANRRYKVTAWVKSLNNTGKIKIRIYEETSSGSQVGSTQYSNEISLTTGWQLLTGFITVQKSTSALSIKVTESPSASNKSFLLDDVGIELLPAVVANGADGLEAGAGLEFRAVVTPNPARGAAMLRFATTRSGPLGVRLFDVSGRVMRVLVDEADAAPGERTIALEGRERVEPGIYFYRIDAGEGTLRGRWVILK